MNGEEGDDEDANAQQRVQSSVSLGTAMPVEQRVHVRGCVERAGGLEHDAQLAAIGIEGGDVIRQRLPFATVALVLGAVLKEIAMKLPQHVRGERDLAEVREDLLHDKGVAGDLLLIASDEGLCLQTTEQRLDLAVAQARALDAGGGTDALDGGDTAQALQPVRSERLPSAPVALELVDLTDEAEHLGGDGDGVGQRRKHGGVSTSKVHFPVQFSPFMSNSGHLWPIRADLG
ncbi:MAG: hypothetical protein CJBNEKGG_03137 [Prosthecobacter sp.]|nr:hypothetical protein [Prosthecobacter sp.]